MQLRSKLVERFGIATVVFVMALCGSQAQSVQNPDAEDFADFFGAGQYEASINAGALFSPFIATYQRPTINYSVTSFELGYMLSNVKGRGLLRGNFEMLGDLFGDAIFKGNGSFITGVTIWGRYNFVQPGWRFVPYAQAGLGLTTTDIDHKIVGQPFNFNLNLGAGTRYMLSSRWALDLEYRFQHISNANTGAHNLGINAHGPVLGISYFF
ncbi:MAG TPA: acyloxyacyl hydrolase [Verrucomicrobiae bacterium]|nr:acyloxyacyl hydrolase [Verrucomicrobiae bacterium]